MKKVKSAAAWIGIILIVLSVLAFFVSAVTGQKHFLAYLYVAWIIPVLLWIFARIADILAKYGPGARDSYAVLMIQEPDFGCEGRPEGETVMCQVKLRHRRSGEEKWIAVSEPNLDEESIIEGSIVKEHQGILLRLADQ